MASVRPKGYPSRDTLLAKYAAGEMDPAESEEVGQWMLSGHANEKQLDHILLILEQCSRLSLPAATDELAAWQRFRQKIERTPDTGPVTRSIYKQMPWIKAAALFILIAGIAVIFYPGHDRKRMQPSQSGSQSFPPAFLKDFSGDHILTDTLPDGSVVTLNKNSSLYYPPKFAGDQRTVRLEGEATFSVAHDPHKPFRVGVRDIQVTVLGTSFSIRSTTLSTEIAVQTGVIEVARQGHRVRLFSGEKLSVSPLDTGLPEHADTSSLPARSSSGKSQPKNQVTAKTPIPAKAATARLPDDPARQKEILRSIIRDLVQEHIVQDRNSLVSFGLSDEELIVNGNKQPEQVHQKFKEKYLSDTGYGFYYGPVQMTGKGVFFNKQDLEN